MASRKVTVTLPEELVEALSAAAAAEGIPMSRLVARATEHELRLRHARAFVADWQAQHGDFAPEELAHTNAELAAAEADALTWQGARSGRTVA